MIRYFKIEGNSTFEEFQKLTPAEAAKAASEPGITEIYFGDQGDGTPWTGLVFENGKYSKHGLHDPFLDVEGLIRKRGLERAFQILEEYWDKK
jgi:hypothetical protein